MFNYKKTLITALFFFLVPFFNLSHSVNAAARSPLDSPINSTPPVSTLKYVPGEVIIKFKTSRINLTTNDILSKLREFSFLINKNLITDTEFKAGNAATYKITNSQSVEDVIANLKDDPNIEYIEPNYISQPSAISTTDTYKAKLWGLDNTGQVLTLGDGTSTVGSVDADIDLPEAWAYSTGTTEVIVAVIDTGVAYNHPDLVNNMWDGTNCLDQNGTTLGGCLHGFNFDTGNTGPNPLPTDSSHGTHVAGIIAATSNNNKGVLGVGPLIKIMAIKCDLTTSCLVNSIDFATRNGAKVINASYAGPSYSASESDAIDRFRAAGGVFIAAAGNASNNNDGGSHLYPSDYNLSNIISVAASDLGDSLATFSNYGGTSVDIAAPGVDIYSTWAESNQYSEGFGGLVNGQIPAGWVKSVGSSWGIYILNSSSGTLPVLYPDPNYPYLDSAPTNTTVESGTINLTGISTAKFDFITRCKTENTDPSGGNSDYMTLEASPDGTNFNELSRWNTYTIGSTGSYISSDITLASQYQNSNFKFRFRWVTNGNGLYGGDGDGCLISDLKIVKYSDGADETYNYLDGTSMAAPLVSGLAGYLFSVKPAATASEIISNILSNGDTKPAFVGKTVTGMRINAYNSVIALGITTPVGPTITGLTDDATPTKNKTWSWSSDTPSTDSYRYVINTTLGTGSTGTYSVGLTGAYTGSWTGTVYLHVQAKSQAGVEGVVKTVSTVLDNSGPIATVTNDSQYAFTANYGENLYNVSGQTLAVGTTFTPSFANSVGTTVIAADYIANQQVGVSISGAVTGSKAAMSINTFYDSLGNGVGTAIGPAPSSTGTTFIYNGVHWLPYSSSNILSIGSTAIPELFISGQFIPAIGTSTTSTTYVTVSDNIAIDVGASATPDTITLPMNLVISEYGDQNFDATQIQTSVVDKTTITNLASGYIPEAAVQWGIPGTTLKFNSPITIDIYLGPSFNGQTLSVFRSTALGVGWTNNGIVLPGNCVVSSGYCRFTATQASYYVASSFSGSTPTPTPTPTSAPAAGNTGSSVSVSSIKHEAPQCTAKSPVKTPDLFAIKTTKGSAQLIFTPVEGKVTGYAVIYGLKKGEERFGAIFNTVNNNHGEQNAIINKLDPKVTYYFKVAALNDCTSSPWSTWVPAKANRKASVYKYKQMFTNKVLKLIEIIFK